jgi:CelD/BcsL family acetyltransferase involved in cellulose biosynthesis
LSASAPLRICLARDVRDFADFWPRWNRRGAARFYPFQCAEILELQCDTFVKARNSEPVFVALLDRDDAPLMLIPLMIQPYTDYTRFIKNIRILKFLDFGFTDYNAPVVFPLVSKWNIKTVQAVWKSIRKFLPSFDIALLDKMPERVSDLPNPLSLLRTASDQYTGHMALLSGGWQEFASKLPSRQRWRSRRFREFGERKLALAETPEQYDVFVEALIRQKRQRYPTCLTLPEEVAYMKIARRHLYPAGPVCLFALKVNDTVIAVTFCLLMERRLIAQFVSDEKSWRPYSPGHLILNMICEWCFVNQLQILDFGIGDESYKNDYCDITIRLRRAEIPANVKGFIAYYWRAAGDWKRERRQRLAEPHSNNAAPY